MRSQLSSALLTAALLTAALLTACAEAPTARVPDGTHGDTIRHDAAPDQLAVTDSRTLDGNSPRDGILGHDAQADQSPQADQGAQADQSPQADQGAPADQSPQADQGAQPDQRVPMDLGPADALVVDTHTADSIPSRPPVSFPRGAISARELALVINDADPASVEVGAYYKGKRGIPDGNIVHITLPTGAAITAAQFQVAKDAVDKALGPKVQAIALAWMKPYRVKCMSITTAFALGFDESKYCSKPCSATSPSSYYASTSTAPFTDFGMRPTMMLAGVTAADAKILIDRGLMADGTFPTGDAIFVRTTDKNRSVRWGDFKSTATSWDRPEGIVSEYIDNSGGSASNTIANRKGVLFYFTGLTTVPDIKTNTYRPGAVADHLTSSGGALDGKNQMSIVRWLEAGATGSYGTCVEPCNYTSKFPRTSVLLRHYFSGNTLIEAYWKSVHWPGEGVFIGDPLARPWGSKVTYRGPKMSITTTTLAPSKTYAIEGKSAQTGEWVKVVNPVSLKHYQQKTIVIDPMKHVAYRLVLLP